MRDRRACTEILKRELGELGIALRPKKRYMKPDATSAAMVTQLLTGMLANHAGAMLPPSAEGHLTRLAAARLAGDSRLEPLLRAAGLTRDQLDDARGRVAVEGQIKFLQLAADALQDDLFGFHLAQAFEPRQLGLFYYVLASASTLKEALAHLCRYSLVANEGVKISCANADYINLTLEYVGVPRHLDTHQMEFFIVGLLRICRQLTAAQLVPIAVSLAHTRRAGSGELRAFLGCPLSFRASRDAITISRDSGSLPIVSADPYLQDALQNYWEQALSRRTVAHSSIRAAVENAILPLLPHGTARLDKVAASLHLSPRTLARRMAEEGLNFAFVLDGMRHALAQRYIADDTVSISEIAWLLGYSEVSAFSHACKRWTGETPIRLRRQKQSRTDQLLPTSNDGRPHR